MDDEGYEGSGEEVVVRRGRLGRRRRGGGNPEPASGSTGAAGGREAEREGEREEEGAEERTESEGLCNGRTVESEETIATSPSPGDHDNKDEVSMETETPVNKPSPGGVKEGR